MELAAYFKSILEQDRTAIVICNLQHEIIYRNPEAIRRYEKNGRGSLLGQSLLGCHGPQSNQKIKEVVAWFAQSTGNNIVYTHHNEKENRDVYMLALRDETGALIGYYEKHEFRNRETAAPYEMG